MSKRPDSFMPWYIGDYLRDTMHLTTRQHGAYDLLLLRYWASGKPLPNDEDVLRAITKLSAGEWKADRAKILAFFHAEDDGLHQKRADLELARASAVYAKRREASAKGNSTRWAGRSAGDTGSESQSDTPGDRTRTRRRIAGRSQPQPHPHDLNLSGSNRCGARTAQRGASAAPSAPHPDWAAPSPRWRTFRGAIGEGAWACWFAGCRLDGAETTLLAPGAHTRDELNLRFGPALAAHFGAPVAILFEPAKWNGSGGGA